MGLSSVISSYFKRGGIAELRELPEDRDLFSISWNLSDVCNYKCTYCGDDLNGGKFKFPSMDRIQGFISAIERSTAGRRVLFELKGGEPTLWRELPDLVNRLRSRGWQSVLVTNGSRRPEWWSENGARFDIVVLSFHPGQSSIDHFIEVIRLLGTRAMCGVLVAMDPLHFDQGVDAVRRLRDAYPALSVTPIILAEPGGCGRMYTYTDEQKHWFENVPSGKWPEDGQVFRHFENPAVRGGREQVRVVSGGWREREETLNGEQLKNRGMNSFRGWSCSVGLKRLHIETDGTIFRGQCRAGDPIGSIYDPELVLPVEPVKCHLDYCFCGPEVMLPKRHV